MLQSPVTVPKISGAEKEAQIMSEIRAAKPAFQSLFEGTFLGNFIDVAYKSRK